MFRSLRYAVYSPDRPPMLHPQVSWKKSQSSSTQYSGQWILPIAPVRYPARRKWPNRLGSPRGFGPESP